MIGSAIDVFRLRQYFNVITRTRELIDGLRDDAGFLDDARRALVKLPFEAAAATGRSPFPPFEPFPTRIHDGQRLAVIATGGSGALASVVGVGRALEEAGVRPAVISLCSGSALFGFPLAAGIPADDVAAFTTGMSSDDYIDLDWGRLLRVVSTAGRGFAGILTGDAIEKAYRRLVGDMTLGELPIPAYAPIWNIEENRLEYLGPRTYPDVPVARAVRMAVALPLFIQPAALGGHQWCDGGIVDIFPVHPVLDIEDPCDVVLAINGFYPPEFVGEDATGWQDRRASILYVASQVRTCQQVELARENLARLRSACDVTMMEPVPYEKVRGVGFYRQFLSTREWPQFMQAGRAAARRALHTTPSVEDTTSAPEASYEQGSGKEAQLDDFMRESDAFSWYMERDPGLRSTIVAVAWLEESPDWEVVVDKVDRASRSIPLFRMRPVEPPARVAPPRWTIDPEFDLRSHLHRIDSPAPHTPATVMELARQAAVTGFDSTRPLWEFTLVDNLEGGRAALVMKIHHSLTDGIGGMELALRLFDLEPVSPAAGPIPEAPAGTTAAAPDLLLAGLRHDRDRVVGVAGHEVLAAVPAAVRAARHPLRTMTDVIETAKSIARTVAPVSETLSPLMTERGLGRDLDMVSVRLDDLKRAAAAAGGSVNDGFVASIAGGLRLYHERHGSSVGDLRLTMPISIRTPSDPVAGNRITLQRFTVPAGTADPAERIKQCRRQCQSARAERSLGHTNAIAGTLNLLPSNVIGTMLKHVDFLASDVPGFPTPVYLGGARLTGYFAFGPTIGAAMNATLLSYSGECCVGITIDTAAVPDPETLVRCIADGFDEVLALAVDDTHASLPLHDGVTGY